MNISQAGYGLIKDEEGFTPVAKGDFGHMEIGYGHDLLPGESYPNGITQAQANGILVQDVLKAETALNPLIPESCTQNQYDALIDFTYECGSGAIEELLAHGWDQVTAQLPLWIHAGGKVLPGMVARRAKEIALFNS